MKIVDEITEIVPHKNNYAHEIESYFQQNELLADSATRRDYFEQLSANDFLDLAQQTANLIRTGDSNAQQSFDGKTVGLMTHEVPDQREKLALLEETWNAANHILHDRSISDELALEYAGLTVAGGLLLAHPFADGNGRTSRALSYVMIRGTDHADELENIIGESSNEGGWAIAPTGGELNLQFGRDFHGPQPDRITWDDHFAGEAVDDFGGTISDSFYKENIIRQFIEDADDETQEIIKAASTTEDGGVSSELQGNRLLTLLAQSNGAVEYASELYSLLRSERARKVSTFLQIMKDDLAWNTKEVDRMLGRRDIRTGEVSDQAKRTRSALAEHKIVDGKLSVRAQRAILHKAYSKIYDQPDEERSDVA